MFCARAGIQTGLFLLNLYYFFFRDELKWLIMGASLEQREGGWKMEDLPSDLGSVYREDVLVPRTWSVASTVTIILSPAR